MTEDEAHFDALFARVATFGWHDRKRDTNLRVHGIDFVDARGVFDGLTFIRSIGSSW